MLEIIRQRIIEEKERLAISVRSMAERSTLKIAEESIRRIINGKISDPGICTVLDIADTVGLQPYELFMDSTLAAEFKVYLALKSKADESEAERIRMLAENEELKATNLGLSNHIGALEMTVKHKEEMISLYTNLSDMCKALIELCKCR